MKLLGGIVGAMAALMLFVSAGQVEAQAKRDRAAERAAEATYARYVKRRLWEATAGAPTQGLTGIVHFRFVVTRSGQVRSISLQKSSGHRFLDAVALRIIDRATPFKPMPAVIKEDMTVNIPFRFTR